MQLQEDTGRGREQELLRREQELNRREELLRHEEILQRVRENSSDDSGREEVRTELKRNLMRLREIRDTYIMIYVG